MKPFSEACERNKEPIATELVRIFAQSQRILEIGSGTGQHAAYFALKLPHARWLPSDLAQHHEGICGWIKGCKLDNIDQPLALDVTQAWPAAQSLQADALFSANTLHIMSWQAVEAFFQGTGQILAVQAKLVVYGPFKLKGEFTSESNAKFEAWLKERDPDSGVRDFEAVDALARAQGFVLQERLEMPANNFLLHWQKHPPQKPGLMQTLRDKLSRNKQK